LTLLTPTQDLIEILPRIDQTMKALIAGRRLGKATVVVGDEIGQAFAASIRPAGRPGRNATGLLQSDKPEIDHGRNE